MAGEGGVKVTNSGQGQEWAGISFHGPLGLCCVSVRACVWKRVIYIYRERDRGVNKSQQPRENHSTANSVSSLHDACR